MIPKMCIEAIIDILDLLFGSIAAAPIPNSVTHYLGLGLSYISSGLSFLASYEVCPDAQGKALGASRPSAPTGCV